MSELHQKSRSTVEIATLSGKWINLRVVARRYFRWALVFGEFGAVQALVQGFLAVAGLLIVRSLSKQEYALFVIANSMQTTCNLLADLGIGIGVRSIGGRVWNDRFRFGQLLNTALELRGRFALVSFGVCLPVTAWMLWQNGATTFVTVGLCAAVVAGTIPLLASSVWDVSPVLHGEYRRIQNLDSANAALRLLLIGTLALFWITAWSVALVGVITNWIHSLVMRRFAQEKADFLAPTNKNDRRELVRLAVKSGPNAIFFCFQGQVTLLILTVLGNPTSIADFTALGRIAVLFSIFSISFNNVLAPRFARCQEPARLPGLYLLFVGGTALLLLPLVGLVYFIPGPFLWLLGEKYRGLENELLWVVIAACISQIAGVLWSLNTSKAWIAVYTYGFIPTMILAQVAAALILDLRQFHDILLFNIVLASAPLLVFAADGWLRLRAIGSSAKA